MRYLKHLKQKYHISFLATWDELIMADLNWLSDLCDEIIAQRIDLRIFTSGGRADLVDGPILKKMKRAGFIRISYGIESGSQKILDTMKKKTTVLQNYNAVKTASEEGIFVHLNMIVGMVNESLATLRETSRFLFSLAKEGIIRSENVSFSYATGYPGTELYQYMLDKRIVEDTERYLKEQKGVVEYKYNLCGVNKKLLQSAIFIMLLRIDFYYYLARKK